MWLDNHGVTVEAAAVSVWSGGVFTSAGDSLTHTRCCDAGFAALASPSRSHQSICISHTPSSQVRSLMEGRFAPESVDLAALRGALEETCGAFVEGDVVGRTRLRDEVARRLACSVLDAERIVDTMVGRGFLRRQTAGDGRTGWSTSGSA